MKKPIRQVFGKLLPAVLLAAVMVCSAMPAVSEECTEHDWRYERMEGETHYKYCSKCETDSYEPHSWSGW